MADYHCWPLRADDPDEFGNIDPGKLPISLLLAEKLNLWAFRYDETLNLDNPVQSSFKTIEAKEAFKKDGVNLAEELQHELGPTYAVIYQLVG